MLNVFYDAIFYTYYAVGIYQQKLFNFIVLWNRCHCLYLADEEMKVPTDHMW